MQAPADDGSAGEEAVCLAFLAGAASQAALGILQTWHVSRRRSFGILAVLEMPAYAGVRVVMLNMAVEHGLCSTHRQWSMFNPRSLHARHCTATGGSSSTQQAGAPRQSTDTNTDTHRRAVRAPGSEARESRGHTGRGPSRLTVSASSNPPAQSTASTARPSDQQRRVRLPACTAHTATRLLRLLLSVT